MEIEGFLIPKDSPCTPVSLGNTWFRFEVQSLTYKLSLEV